MHTRLKEPDRWGNADRLHHDYRIRIRFSTISRYSLQWGLQQYQKAVAAYSRQATDYGERVLNMKSGPIGRGMGGRWFTRNVLQGDFTANCHE
jgi:hypothetical protein